MKGVVFDLFIIWQLCRGVLGKNTDGLGVRALYKVLLHDYNTACRPVRNASDVVKVTIGFVPMHIANVDERNQYVSMKAMFGLYWTDEFLVWNQSEFNVGKIYITPDQIWTPDIRMYNNIDGDYDMYGGDMKALVKPNGQVHLVPDVSFSFLCNISVSKYPFDTQICYINMASWHFTIYQQILTSASDELSLAFFRHNTEWHLSDISVACGFIYGGQHSTCDFKMTLKRRSSYHVMNVLFPVSLLAVMTPFVFVLPQSSGERISYSLTLFLAFSVTMTSITGKLPVTSLEVCYLEVLVQFQLFLSAVQTCCLVLSLSVGVFGNDKDIPVVLRNIALHFKRRKYLKNKPKNVTETETDPQEEQQSNITIDVTGSEVSNCLDVILFVVFLGILLISFVVFGLLMYL